VKLLHVSSEYPPAHVFGLGRFVHGLARAQARAGHEVHVLTNSCGGREDDAQVEGVHLHRIPFPNPPQPPDGQGEVFQFNHGALSRFFARPTLQQVELVVAHDWLTVPSAREIARRLEVPLVFTVHDEIVGKRFGALDPASETVFELERLGCRDASRVIANSAFIATQLLLQHGAPGRRVAVAQGGVDEAFAPRLSPAQRAVFRAGLAAEHEQLVVYVGRLDAEKGLETLAEACLALGRERHDVRFAFAGRGSWQAWLESTLAPLAERVRFLGYLPRDVVAALYQVADAVVVPSAYEPLGLVAREAQRAGAAVVAAASGGLREVVTHERDGLLVPPADPQALSEALRRLGDDPELAARLGEAARDAAAEVGSWDALARQALEVYADAVDDPVAIRDTPPVASLGLDVSLIQLGGDPARLASALAETQAVDALWVGPARALPTSLAHVEASADTPQVEALRAAVERAFGEYVCVVGRGVAGGSGWLETLLRQHRTLDAGAVVPTLCLPDGTPADPPRPGAPPAAGAPTRVEALGLDALLVRRDALQRALDELGEGPLADLAQRLGEAGPLWRSATPVRVLEPLEPAPAVVMVAYDGRAVTQQGLQALLDHTRPPYRLVLVDNGSQDGTAALFDRLEQAPPAGVDVVVVRNAENLGYPVAANQGIAAAGARDVVLLNNDTEVRPGWLRALLTCRRAATAPGIVTAKVLDFDGTVQSAGGILHDPDGRFVVPGSGADRLSPEVTRDRELTSAGGPCMLLTRELLAAVGGFDEAFSPGYFEDSDLCLRARDAGFSLHYAAESEVYHHAKATSSLVAERGELDVWGQFPRNQALFLERWGEQLAADQAARCAAPDAAERLRIVLCYGASDTTTAAYCERALRAEHDVVTAGPGQELDFGPEATAAEVVAAAGGADLLLAIEGENYTPRELSACPCPTAWWAIDSHLHVARAPRWHLERAQGFDHVFVAQPDYLPAFRARGVEARWLPLACDPELHRGQEVARDLDLVFVGHVRPFHQRRRRLLERLAQRFELTVAQDVWGDDMARLLSRAKLAFNCSLAGDVNMRVYEAMAAGALLVTDRAHNGLETLFADGEHLVAYDDPDLEAKVAWALEHAAAREAIAARGQALVLGHHTYAHRMRELVRQVSACACPRLDPERSLA